MDTEAFSLRKPWSDLIPLASCHRVLWSLLLHLLSSSYCLCLSGLMSLSPELRQEPPHSSHPQPHLPSLFSVLYWNDFSKMHSDPVTVLPKTLGWPQVAWRCLGPQDTHSLLSNVRLPQVPQLAGVLVKTGFAGPHPRSC